MQIELDGIDAMLILEAINTEIDFLNYCTERTPELQEDTELSIETLRDLQERIKKQTGLEGI